MKVDVRLIVDCSLIVFFYGVLVYLDGLFSDVDNVVNIDLNEIIVLLGSFWVFLDSVRFSDIEYRKV